MFITIAIFQSSVKITTIIFSCQNTVLIIVALLNTHTTIYYGYSILVWYAIGCRNSIPY